jgi:hypothetical protein
MPRLFVRQEVIGDDLCWYSYSDSGPPPTTKRIPGVRLLAELLIGRDPQPDQPDSRRRVQGIVDTGAAVSVIPHPIWSVLPHTDYRLFPPASTSAGGPYREASALGEKFRYQYGVLWMGVVDFRGDRLLAVPVTAQFMLEPEAGAHPLDRPLIGLLESVLTGRKLTRLPSPKFPFEQEWWLQEG